MCTNEVTKLSRVGDSHNLLVKLNVELLAEPLRYRVLPVSVAVMAPASISLSFCLSGPSLPLKSSLTSLLVKVCLFTSSVT
jgi:hypothetical protein